MWVKRGGTSLSAHEDKGGGRGRFARQGHFCKFSAERVRYFAGFSLSAHRQGMGISAHVRNEHPFRSATPMNRVHKNHTTQATMNAIKASGSGACTGFHTCMLGWVCVKK